MSESSKGGPRALTPEELTWCCEGIRLEFETTEDLEPLTGTIGQERALKALSLGLNLYAPGYNMFVCGLSGTRKMETVQEILEHLEPRSALPPDRAYVHNFRSPDQPVLLTFPRGKARRFAFEMDRLVEDLKVALSGLTREESLARRRQKVIKQYEEKGTELFKPFEEKARDSGFGIVQVASPGGVRPTLVPIWEDKPTQWSELEEKVAEGEFSAEDLESKRERFGDLHLEMEQLVARSMGLGRDLRQELRELTRGLAWEIVKEHVGGLREEWGEGPEGKIGRYLDQAEMAVVEDLEIFIQGEKDEKPGGPVAENTHQHIGTADEDPFVEYRVKVVLDAEKMGECPIITEQTPTHQNIFGTVEYVGEKGATTTNHTRIKAGDILEADGGYLVLDAYDAIMEPGVWTDLKRTLLHQKLQLQPVWPGGVSFVTRRLKPEPIPIATKVLMVGDRYLYNTLMTLDDDFLRAFKVLVDFDDEVDLTDESIGLMARFVARIVREEGLAHFTRGGVAAVVTRAVRETGDRSKMSARLNIIADLMREADHLRAIAKDTAVEESHILEALEGIEFRHNLIEEKIQEAIQKDVVMIDSSGDRVGVLNGGGLPGPGRHRQHRARGRPQRLHPRQGGPDPVGLPQGPLRPGEAPEPGGLARLRAVLRHGGRRQRLIHGAVRADVRPLGAGPAPGHRRDRFRQPEGRGPGDRRGEREDRGLLRGLQGEGTDRDPGGDDPRVQRPAPRPQGGSGPGGAGSEIPRLGRRPRGRGHQPPDGEAGRGADRGRDLDGGLRQRPRGRPPRRDGRGDPRLHARRPRWLRRRRRRRRRGRLNASHRRARRPLGCRGPGASPPILPFRALRPHRGKCARIGPTSWSESR